MEKIIKENGNIWLEETKEYYGLMSTRKILIGTYDENKEKTNEEKPKKAKKKKSEE